MKKQYKRQFVDDNLVKDIPFQELFEKLNKEMVQLQHWLYSNHLEIWRDYEKNVLKTKLRMEFA